jgi:tRNA(fMet)-specific endonuclease VapC
LGILIDTSALVALERGPISWNQALEQLGNEPAALPAIVLAELLVGVELAESDRRRNERRAKIDALVSRVPVVEFGSEIAPTWAMVFSDLKRSGGLIPSNDLLVAVTALQIGFAVLVGPTDEAHFRRVPNLRVQVLA